MHKRCESDRGVKKVRKKEELTYGALLHHLKQHTHHILDNIGEREVEDIGEVGEDERVRDGSELAEVDLLLLDDKQGGLVLERVHVVGAGEERNHGGERVLPRTREVHLEALVFALVPTHNRHQAVVAKELADSTCSERRDR